MVTYTIIRTPTKQLGVIKQGVSRRKCLLVTSSIPFEIERVLNKDIERTKTLGISYKVVNETNCYIDVLR